MQNFNFTDAGYSPPSEYDFDFGDSTVRVFYVVAGNSNNFVTIWADSNTGLSSGKLYVSSTSAFSVVDMTDNSLFDYYTTSHAGAGNETLESATVIDINGG